MVQPPKKPRPQNSKYGGPPPRNNVKPPSMPQAKNLTPPNATGVKKGKPTKKKSSGRVTIGTGKNGLYW